jgi:hypothetical protein
LNFLFETILKPNFYQMAIHLNLKLKVITTSHELGNIKMLKKSVLVFALLTSITPFSSMAGLITSTQTQNYSGTAGDDSSGAGGSIANLQFLKFDTLLGTLDNIFVQYSMTISDGLIGADNKTNAEVTVTGKLGGELTLTSDQALIGGEVGGSMGFSSIFSKLAAQHNVEFTLAADPTESTGPGGGTGASPGNPGAGDDVDSFDGTPKSDESVWYNINSAVFNSYKSGAGDTTFDVFFDTTSITEVVSASTQGFFETVDIDVEMQLYYEYTAAVVPPVVGIPEPAVFAFGLLMLCAVTGRKFLK